MGVGVILAGLWMNPADGPKLPGLGDPTPHWTASPPDLSPNELHANVLRCLPNLLPLDNCRPREHDSHRKFAKLVGSRRQKATAI